VIRPILYVNLPGVVYALDRRARSRRGEFATFICAPDAAEPQSRGAAFLEALTLINPSALTWICEDRWHLLGIAQARRRTGAEAWDLAYLAALAPPPGQPAGSPARDEVLLELLQYALNVALRRGVQRVFASVDDDRPEMELFGRVGFQRYARELSYWLAGPATAAAEEASTTSADDTPGRCPEDPPLRHWHRHDGWGLLRLHDAVTPRRVQVAECLGSEEYLASHIAGDRASLPPLVGPKVRAFVCDRGVRLGGWLRLSFGRGAQPHQIWLMVHPEDAQLAGPLLRSGLRLLAAAQPRPILCQVREYDATVINALRAAGFEHGGTRALLVRHLTLRALRPQVVPALDSRVAYGVKGLGTAHSQLNRGDETSYATGEW
jgi:hypothetical protein